MTQKTIYNYEEQPMESKDGWTLLIDGLQENCNEEILRQHFSVYGKINQIFNPFNRRNGGSASYAFVKFIDKESAIAARRDMDGVEILEKVITVSFACVVKNEIKKDEDLNRRVGVKKVRMRDITFGRRDLKKKNKNKKKQYNRGKNASQIVNVESVKYIF